MKVNLQIFKRQIKRSLQLIAVMIVLMSFLRETILFSSTIIVPIFIWAYYLIQDTNLYLLKGIIRKEFLQSFFVTLLLTIVMLVLSYMFINNSMFNENLFFEFIRVNAVIIFVSGLSMLLAYLVSYYTVLGTFLMIVYYLFAEAILSVLINSIIFENSNAGLIAIVTLMCIGIISYWSFYKSMLGVDVK